MDLWQRARNLAEDAASKTHELTKEAARLSQDLTIGSSFKLSDIVSEAAKLLMEIAARAQSIKADAVTHIPATASGNHEKEDNNNNVEERFGVTDDLRDFVKGITANTFRDFLLQDDSEVSNIPTVSNVRQDLTAWQEKHAKIVLSTVKEISKLRYELCPRAMKERKFWRIYFILVNSHVSPYEKQYTEEAMLKSAEEAKNDKRKESSISGTLSESEVTAVNQKNKTSSSNEQDLDVFLLGDLGDSDEGPDDGDQDFDDDFDKL